MLILHGTALDAGEVVAQAHGDLAGLSTVDVVPTTGVLHGAHRGDHGGGAAGQHLGEHAGVRGLLPLLDGDAALVDGVAQVPGDLDQGVAGNTRQQGAGELRGDDLGVLPLAEDEHEVHATHLLDPLALDGVQPHNLVAALLGGLGLGHEGTGVVTGALRGTGAAGRGAHVLSGQPHAHRLDAAGEVGARRGGDDHVGVGLGRLDTQVHVPGDHQRAQVQRGLAACRWHPLVVDGDQLLQGLEEQVLRQRGHAQALGGARHALGVLLRAEGRDAAVRLAVGLDALEDGLAVVEDHAGRVHGQRAIGLDAGVVPADLLVVVDEDHVVGEVDAEARALEDLGDVRGGGAVLVRRDGEAQIGVWRGGVRCAFAHAYNHSSSKNCEYS